MAIAVPPRERSKARQPGTGRRPTGTPCKLRGGLAWRGPSKALSDAEEEVEVRSLPNSRRIGGVAVVDENRVDGRVEVITQVEAERPDRRVVAKARAERMGKITEAALAVGFCIGACSRGDRAQVPAGLAMGLGHSQDAGPDLRRFYKYVAHVVEGDQSEAIADVGQLGAGETHLGAVHKGGGTSDGEAGLGIAGAGGVDPE